ncbi:MAG: hypothetical protein E6G40_05045 [Actinobacteria bacterium]|nr:MAG: hypothetical protein E6G44_09995 [Actinomycetota bacterium]TML00778.1 MAG: hypothetical protein E6G40_05045 [Actinomycetota bacterium]
MPDTFQAIVVVALALLPGALYVWSFERLVGAWGIGLSDRVLRFVGVSAILHSLFAPLTYRLWFDFVRSGRVDSGHLPLWLWLAPLTYVAIPMALGSLVGVGTLRGDRWARLLTGSDPAPRAWDYLFKPPPDGWIRLKLKSGTWLAGAYAQEDGWKSYASGYPEPQDLFLVEAVEVDPDTGEFLFDDEGDPKLRGSGILIKWDEVEYLEFIDA